MSAVAYRLATADDLEALVKLRMAFLAEVNVANPADAALRYAVRNYFLTAIPNGEFIAVVAESGGDIVSTCGMVYHVHPPLPKNRSGRTGHILNMYTLPTFRRQGIATQLLQMLLGIAREGGCERASLHAMPLGRPVYEKLGFKPVDNEMRLHFQ